MVSLVEDLMLVLLDDESGRAVVDRSTLEKVLAGAVLLDLANGGRVVPAGAGGKGTLVVQDRSATGDPVLDAGLARLGAKPVKARRAVELLAKGVRDAVLARLADRGLVRVEKSAVLGIFPMTRWPANDTAHEKQLRDRLGAVLLHGADPDPRTAGLIVLLHAGGSVHKVIAGDRKRLAARAREVAAGDWAGAAVKEAIRHAQAAVQAAIMAAVTASAASATSAGSSGC